LCEVRQLNGRTVTSRSTANESWMSLCTVSRYVTTLFVCVLALTSSFYAGDHNSSNISSSSNDNVLRLTTKNFDLAVAATEHLLVQFREYSSTTLPALLFLR